MNAYVNQLPGACVGLKNVAVTIDDWSLGNIAFSRYDGPVSKCLLVLDHYAIE